VSGDDQQERHWATFWRRSPTPGAAALTAAERLAEIPGVSPRLAMATIAETGLDMTRFPTAARLVSCALSSTN